MKKIRYIVWALATLAIVYAAYVIASVNKQTESGQQQDVPIGGNFTLIDQNGKIVSNTDFKGKYMLVFFGFTHCPTICPPAMATMSEAYSMLGSDKDELAIIMVSVDPERDTPPVMKEFVTQFEAPITGLTGKREDIKKLISDYKVYANRVDDKDQPDGYIMDHSGIIYLMDKSGKYLYHFTPEQGSKEMADKIKEYL